MDQKGVGLMKREPILTARGLNKRYGRVVALDGADFDLYPGEILGVIGDNGAGKSTLIKALVGAVAPDEGEIRLDGQVVNFRRQLKREMPALKPCSKTLPCHQPCRLLIIFSWAANCVSQVSLENCFVRLIKKACRILLATNCPNLD